MMSAWRSPLLFLGIGLIAIAAAALVAPLFVDWNVYRADIEDYGRKITGRTVTIAGPIEARLFPWPALVLNEVTIANPEGTWNADLMEARRIQMGMSLAPLISGNIEVDTIAIDGPVFAFERLASGAASWTIEPDQSLPALIDPERVAVSEISITDGTVLAGDHRRDGFTRIDGIAATLSAPSLSGPWRVRATASHGGLPFEVNLSTGKIKAGEATRVGLRIAPVAEAGMVYSFDGEIGRPEDSSLKGSIKVAPAVSDSGKEDAATAIPRFELKAGIEGDFDTMLLSDIEASPAFSTDPGNFITGAARIDLGSRVVVDAALSTARFDLDRIAGRHGRELMRSANAMEALGSFLSRTPEALELHVDLAAASVIAGGETLDASRLSFELDRDRLRIREFTTALPGQTRTRFSGVMMFGEGEPLMSGDISVESVSLRDFVGWAFPQRLPVIDDLWSGSRGHLTLEGKLDVSAGGARLSEVDATLDEARITGSLSSQGGENPGLAVRIDADRIDLDRYLPRGFGEWADGRSGASDVPMALADVLRRSMTLGDFQLTAQAAALYFHGVEARDIAIDFGADEDSVELRTVEIGQVGAARMSLAGIVSFPGDGIAGSLNGLIDAEDPRELLRLLGAFGLDEAVEPAWAKTLGPLDLKLVAEASAEDSKTTALVALTGTAGEASAAVEGRFSGEWADWRSGEIEVSGELDARSSKLVAAVTGLELTARPETAASPVRPTRLAGSLAGSLREGLATTLEAELLGAKGQFIGTIVEGRRMVEAKGRLAVLAEDAAELLAIVGVATDELSPTAQVLAAESEVTYDGRGLRLPSLSGTAGGAAFSGNVTFVSDPVRRVSGKIEADSLSLPWLLGAILLPRDGTPHGLSDHFATAVPALEADLTIATDRLQLLPHVAVEAAEVKVDLGRYGLSIEGRGSGREGQPATGRIAIDLDSRGVAVDGAVAGPVDLGAVFKAGDGSPVMAADSQVELEFHGGGRSPAGVLAALQAEGSYEVASGVLKRVDPEAFARDLAKAKQPSEIDGLFSRSLRSGDMDFVGGSGSLQVADGVLTAKPLDILGQGITGEARFLLEAASGDVDLSFTLGLAGQEGIPTFELAYAGPPRDLEPSTDARNLKSYLSMQMLQESVQQLEELQRQEEELIEAEKKFQREQEERERQWREEEQREADMKLDRKQREVAVRLRAEAEEAERRKVESRKADREATESEPEPTGEPELVPEAQQQPDPATGKRSDTVTGSPLDAPVAASLAGDPVPVPRTKPEPAPATAETEPVRVFVEEPLQLPPDGNLGRIPQPVFSGPAVLQAEPTNESAVPNRVAR